MAVCSSTALTNVFWKSLIWFMILPICPIASTDPWLGFETLEREALGDRIGELVGLSAEEAPGVTEPRFSLGLQRADRRLALPHRRASCKHYGMTWHRTPRVGSRIAMARLT